MMTIVCYLVSESCVCFSHNFGSVNLFFLLHTDIGRVIGEQRGYAIEIMNERYMSQKLDNT
jgi:hypothetical protein